MKDLKKILNSALAWYTYLILITGTLAYYYQITYSKEYKILVIFCDNRANRVVILSFNKKPTNYELSQYIETSNLAISNFFGLKNVCEAKLIE